MAFISGFDRKQTALFPPSVDELIEENNIARLVKVFINRLDLQKFGVLKTVQVEEARHCYNHAVEKKQ